MRATSNKNVTKIKYKLAINTAEHTMPTTPCSWTIIVGYYIRHRVVVMLRLYLLVRVLQGCVLLQNGSVRILAHRLSKKIFLALYSPWKKIKIGLHGGSN